MSRTHDPFVRWDTLGTYAYLAVDDPAHLEAAFTIARDVLAEVDRTCSRFREDSDLTAANSRPGEWVAVDPLLVAAVDVAVEAARVTDGLVDPCLGRTLVLLGYDSDMAQVRARRTGPAALPVAHPQQAWREIRTDPAGALRVPDGCAVDLGATAKAWASDLVAASVVDRLGCHLLVSLGGDIRTAGPDGHLPHGGWPVHVTEVPGGAGGQQVVLGGGGLATSSTRVRRWAHGTRELHHLVDPRTGRPTDEHWRTATATGPTCVSANIATTAALVLGAEATDWLEERGVAARLVGRGGTVTRVGAWPVSTESRDVTDELNYDELRTTNGWN